MDCLVGIITGVYAFIHGTEIPRRAVGTHSIETDLFIAALVTATATIASVDFNIDAFFIANGHTFGKLTCTAAGLADFIFFTGIGAANAKIGFASTVAVIAAVCVINFNTLSVLAGFVTGSVAYFATVRIIGCTAIKRVDLWIDTFVVDKNKTVGTFA